MFFRYWVNRQLSDNTRFPYLQVWSNAISDSLLGMWGGKAVEPFASEETPHWKWPLMPISWVRTQSSLEETAMSSGYFTLALWKSLRNFGQNEQIEFLKDLVFELQRVPKMGNFDWGISEPVVTFDGLYKSRVSTNLILKSVGILRTIIESKPKSVLFYMDVLKNLEKILPIETALDLRIDKLFHFINPRQDSMIEATLPETLIPNFLSNYFLPPNESQHSMYLLKDGFLGSAKALVVHLDSESIRNVKVKDFVLCSCVNLTATQVNRMAFKGEKTLIIKSCGESNIHLLGSLKNNVNIFSSNNLKVPYSYFVTAPTLKSLKAFEFLIPTSNKGGEFNSQTNSYSIKAVNDTLLSYRPDVTQPALKILQ